MYRVQRVEFANKEENFQISQKSYLWQFHFYAELCAGLARTRVVSSHWSREKQKVGDTGDISLLFLKKITLYNPLASDILSKNWLKFDFKLLTEYSSFEHSQSCPWQREEYGGLWVIRLLMWQNDRLHNLIFWKFDHNSNSIAPLIKCGGWWVVPSSIYLMCVWLCEVVAVLILRIVGYTIHKTLQS